MEQRHVAARMLLDAEAAGLGPPKYSQNPLLAGVANPGRLAKRFASRLAANQPPTDAPHSGRPRKVTDEEAAEAAAIISNAMQPADGSRAQFLSQQDAVRLETRLNELCTERRASVCRRRRCPERNL